MERKTVWLLIPSLIIIVILVIGFLIVLGIPIHPISREYCGCHYMTPNYFLLFFSILLTLSAVPILYYFASRKVEEKIDKHTDLLLKLVKTKVPKNNLNLVDKQAILKFLNPSEQRVLRRLIENKKWVLQSDISNMENMTKLKAHRAVKNLEQKRVIKREPYGKTNKIALTEDIKNLLKA